MRSLAAGFSGIWARWAAALGLVGLGSCVEPYVPAVPDAAAKLLVVDGFLNGNGVTRITLSRTTGVNATTAPPPETGARLTLLDDAGRRYNLREASPGRYLSDSVLLDPARRYQLRIVSAASLTYESALMPLKVTPPIDQFKWQLVNNQIRFLLSTHDPQQLSRYYRWGLLETWEFHPAFESLLQYNPVLKVIEARPVSIYTCWRTERVSTIKQASTAQLSQDALTDVQLLAYPSLTERFIIRYSLLVSQYAETPEEFAYYELLRKNTEAVGTVNDPLPTQLTGNVRRLDDPSEPVLGFVSAHTVQTQRLFINRTDLPSRQLWEYDTPYRDCLFNDSSEIVFPHNPGGPRIPRTFIFQGTETSIPISYTIKPPFDTVAYGGTTSFCADCRQRGSLVKPSFW